MLGDKMSSPPAQGAETKYRFSRPVRVWTGAIAFVVAIGATLTCAVLALWEGVAINLLAVFGIGGLLAQQMGVAGWLTSRFPHAPLPRLVVSVAILALVAVVSGDAAVIGSVAGVLLLSNLMGFWWDTRRR